MKFHKSPTEIEMRNKMKTYRFPTSGYVEIEATDLQTAREILVKGIANPQQFIYRTLTDAQTLRGFSYQNISSVNPSCVYTEKETVYERLIGSPDYNEMPETRISELEENFPDIVE